MPAAQQSTISSILETRTDIADADLEMGVSAAESHKPETDKPETNTPEADTPEITTPEHNDQICKFVVASLEVESLDVGHDQTDEAVRPADLLPLQWQNRWPTPTQTPSTTMFANPLMVFAQRC